MAHQAVKFVCVDREDYVTALETWDKWGTVPHRVYFGPAWGRLDPDVLIKWMLNDNLHEAYLNLQVHKYIWDPNARRI